MAVPRVMAVPLVSRVCWDENCLHNGFSAEWPSTSNRTRCVLASLRVV